MKQYHDMIQSRQDAMKSIYSYIITTLSKASWQRFETFFQGVSQRNEQEMYQVAVPQNRYTQEGMKGLQDPLKLMSALRLSHDVYDTSVDADKAYHCLRYLNGSKDLGLRLNALDPVTIIQYIDAAHGDTLTKPVQGKLFLELRDLLLGYKEV